MTHKDNQIPNFFFIKVMSSFLFRQKNDDFRHFSTKAKTRLCEALRGSQNGFCDKGIEIPLRGSQSLSGASIYLCR